MTSLELWLRVRVRERLQVMGEVPKMFAVGNMEAAADGDADDADTD